MKQMISRVFGGALLACLFIAFSTTTISAQSEDETAIRELIQQRSDLLNIMHSAPRINQALNLLTKDYVSRRTVYLPDGETESSRTDIETLKRVLSNYSDSDSHRYRHNISNIPYIEVFNTSAIALATASYTWEDANTGNVLFGSDEIMTFNLKKTPDGWKIRELYTSEIRTTINKYPCPYELYQKDANEMLVNAKVPAGSTFKHEYIDIRFTDVGGGVYTVQTNKGDEFSWEDNTLRSTISNNDSALAGRPNSKKAVCETLIMYYYNDVCESVRMEK